MTQDEINQMVEQAGFHGMLSIGVVMDSKQLEAFAKLVAAKEREACAVACEQELEYWGWNIVFDSAKLIRARGEATHPPQRTWVGLTDDEHCDIWYKESLDWMEYGKAIEAKLKEKNT